MRIKNISGQGQVALVAGVVLYLADGQIKDVPRSIAEKWIGYGWAEAAKTADSGQKAKSPATATQKQEQGEVESDNSDN